MPGFSGCTHLGANRANAAPQLLQEEGRTPACRFGEKGFLESPLPSAGTLPQQFTKGFAMPDQTVRLFGIRHHGPGCARSLLRALEAMQPDCLLIEGPPDGESVLPFVLESGMCPPVALLVYAPDAPSSILSPSSPRNGRPCGTAWANPFRCASWICPSPINSGWTRPLKTNAGLRRKR